MVIKYLSNGVWGYIDHIRQVASEYYDAINCIKEYDEKIKNDLTSSPYEDIASFANGVHLPENITITNKIFLSISNNLKPITDGLNAHIENLVNITDCESDILLPVYSVLLYVEDCKDYEAVILITNQKCFLMNDNGKTIERLA